MEGINNSLTNGRLDPVHSGQGDPVVVRQDTEVQWDTVEAENDGRDV